jgi:hypothetical protein
MTIIEVIRTRMTRMRWGIQTEAGQSGGWPATDPAFGPT